MELESIRVTDVIPASPERIYEAWLDEVEHSKFTGGKATVDPQVGGHFTAWDGYIEGVTQELVPGAKIAQKWRSTDFPPDSADSMVVVTLVADGAGTVVTIDHTEIPVGQGKSYEDGWVEYYFLPMKTYFTSSDAQLGGAKKKGAAKAPAGKRAAPAGKKAAPAGKKAVAKKAAPAGKKATAKKAVAKKPAPAAKKAVAKRAVAKKAAPAARKAVAKKGAAKKAAPAAKKAVAKKAVAKKAAPAAKKAVAKKRY